MATIQLQPSGKVVLKDGKVSCSCCAQPTGCCMYPAAISIAADLPAAITLLGVGSLSKSGTGYGDTTNGVILESGVWARYIGGVRSTKACLIDDDGNYTPGDDKVEDQFAAEYLVSIPSYGDFTISRKSLCLWEYQGTCRAQGDGVFIFKILLFYPTAAFDPSQNFTWVLNVETLEQIDDQCIFEKSYESAPGFSNDPAGDYENLNGFLGTSPLETLGTATVSPL